MGEAERIAERYRRRESLPAGRYSLSEPGNLFMAQQRERLLLRMLLQSGYRRFDDVRLLEIGCGDGWWLRKLVEYGFKPGNLLGVELLPERANRAAALSPNVRVDQGDASHLEHGAGSFDLILQSTVFSSILDESMRRQVAGEMLRVLRPGGSVIWYDMRVDNPRNPDVRGVRKPEIKALFPGCLARFHRTTLAPPLSRRLAPASWTLCHLLSKLPFLLTHYLAMIYKPRR